jgi:hypothetical protein
MLCQIQFPGTSFKRIKERTDWVMRGGKKKEEEEEELDRKENIEVNLSCSLCDVA